MGDLNLDARMELRSDYNRKIPLANLTEFALNENLTQIVTFDTWSRAINGVVKKSLLLLMLTYNVYHVQSSRGGFKVEPVD